MFIVGCILLFVAMGFVAWGTGASGTSDKRFKTGYKDNVVPESGGGCGYIILGLLLGLLGLWILAPYVMEFLRGFLPNMF